MVAGRARVRAQERMALSCSSIVRASGMILPNATNKSFCVTSSPLACPVMTADLTACSISAPFQVRVAEASRMRS